LVKPLSNVMLKFEEAKQCLASQSLKIISEFVLDADLNLKIKKLFLKKAVWNFVL